MNELVEPPKLPPPPPPLPQRCPRCDSINTKFCYYNNYSVSQPRYFCKSCRRYWTQGGTLRNVPVGGGCRKGKRARPSSSGENATPQELNSSPLFNPDVPSSLPPPQPPLPPPPPPPPSIPAINPYISLGTRSVNANQSFTFTSGGGGDFGGSNMALLHGFDMTTFARQQAEFYHMGIAENRQASEWNQCFSSSASTAAQSESSFWNNSNSGGSSLNANQWSDIP